MNTHGRSLPDSTIDQWTGRLLYVMLEEEYDFCKRVVSVHEDLRNVLVDDLPDMALAL
jgi:hypothetical protein